MKYNYFEKKLHDICLGNKLIKKSLYELEILLFLNRHEKINKNPHVFITGLPRSGTTMLLEYVYNSEKFSSLKYLDMPFVLSPNFYSKISKKKNINKVERMHNDAVFYDLDSPEAFEEVFFTTFKDNWKEKIVDYVNLIITKYGNKRYLSKNNYNFQRLNELEKIFPNSKFVMPFRDPLSHATSMMKQHENFCFEQKKDNFTLRYTNYLGHYEFGLNHKPWFSPKKFDDTQNINYWLEQWVLFYQNILDRNKYLKNLIMVCYEDFCEKSEYRKKINFELSIDNQEFIVNNKRMHETKVANSQLLNKCNEIYIELKKK